MKLALTKVRTMFDNISDIFGSVLREARLENKISQEKLAEYSALDRTYISLLETGQRQPTITTIFKIAKALQIEPSELVKKVELKAKNL